MNEKQKFKERNEMSERYPNIILINCDDLGYGDLGCYGSKVNKTPCLDKMAQEGMRFTDYHVMSPVCSASRAAMLTGCYPQRVGIDGVLFPGDPIGLHPDEITIADILKKQGYSTKIVGKWHVGDQPDFFPTNHGFDEYYGLPYSNDMGIQGKKVNYHKRFPLPLMRNEEVIQEQPDQRGLTERYTEECVRFIRDKKESPFFLYLSHMYVHTPLFVPPRFLRQSENGPYGGAVECIDWVSGVIFDELRELGLDDDTMVLFTSDNGSNSKHGGSNLPLRGGKMTTWEGGQRVPLIVRWPGKVPAGNVCDELTTAMDLLPTFAKLASTEEPQDRTIDGKDISSLIMGKDEASSPHDVFYYYRCHNLEAVRVGDWKLRISEGKIFSKGEEIPLELYHLKEDLAETNNVVDSYPDIVKKILVEVEKTRKDLGDLVSGVEGKGIRKVGYNENAKPMTEYDLTHPYIVAAYDTPDTMILGGVKNLTEEG